MDSLLESEIVHCSLLEPNALTIQKIVSIPDTSKFVSILSNELPVRYAVRIKLIESISGWETQQNLKHVRKVRLLHFFFFFSGLKVIVR